MSLQGGNLRNLSQYEAEFLDRKGDLCGIMKVGIHLTDSLQRKLEMASMALVVQCLSLS